MRRLGIDIGSRAVSAAVLEEEQVREVRHREHGGDIAGAVRQIMAGLEGWDLVGVSSRSSDSDARLIDPFLATIEGARFLLPTARNVFAVGAQSFALIFYGEDGRYREHSVNPPCASGTGSFIEQQARRLGLDVEEFVRRALGHAGERPLIATRCAVFAKTDIVHAMQEGYGLEAVCAGLCEGIARNLIDVLVKGRELTSRRGNRGRGVPEHAHRPGPSRKAWAARLSSRATPRGRRGRRCPAGEREGDARAGLIDCCDSRSR